MDLPTLPNANLERFQKMRKEAQEEMEYIPSLRLLQAQTREVSNPPDDITGDPRAGRYYLPGSKTVLLSPVKFIALNVRSYGYRIENDKVIDAWDDIPDHIKQAERQKGVVAKVGYKVFGWLPDQKQFVIFFLAGRGGGRQCGEQVLDYFLKHEGKATPIMFKSRYVPTDKFSWWTSDVCEPNEDPADWALPLPDTFLKVHQLFVEMKAREVEEAGPPR